MEREKKKIKAHIQNGYEVTSNNSKDKVMAPTRRRGKKTYNSQPERQ